MNNAEILVLIEKHKTLNRNCALECMEEGDDDMVIAHSGAITGLEMLRREITGEREYSKEL